MESNIKSMIAKHGKDKVRALINLRPLNVYCGLVAVTSSSDPEVPVLCEVDESEYEVDEGYKITWKPIAPFAPRKINNYIHDIPGFASATFYQSDFDSIVKDGNIKLFVEVDMD
jgi:hypothetical protein